jgi:hypothetical protein
MKMKSRVARSLIVLVSAASLGGCGGASFGSAPNAAPAARFGARLAPQTAVIVPPARHHDRRASWISRGVADINRLLFVSDDVTDDVDIFAMPSMVLKGTLTGFSEPSGLCADRSGSVWVTNTTASDVLRYSRTGKPLGTLTLPGEYPVGCAVNQATGALAVANLTETNGGAGNVTIFPGGGRKRTTYANPNQYEYFFLAYDSAGDLYVDGFDQAFNYVLSELPSGTTTMSTLTISGGTIYYPGGLSWDGVGSYLVVGDQQCGGAISSCLYWVTVSGSAATITGSTPLTNADGSACDVDEGALSPLGDYFAGPCIAQDSTPSIAAVWPYSAGGAPTRSTTSVTYPVGTTISNK